MVCLLQGEYEAREGPYLLARGTKVCGSEPGAVSISGGGNAWEQPVFVLRDDGSDDDDPSPWNESDDTNGFADLKFEEFIIKDTKHLRDDIDLVHVSGNRRSVTFSNIVFDQIVDPTDYFIDCRNNASCLFSNVFFRQTEGGNLLVTRNATAAILNSVVEGLRSTRGAMKFDEAFSVNIHSSTFKSTCPHWTRPFFSDCFASIV